MLAHTELKKDIEKVQGRRADSAIAYIDLDMISAALIGWKYGAACCTKWRLWSAFLEESRVEGVHVI